MNRTDLGMHGCVDMQAHAFASPVAQTGELPFLLREHQHQLRAICRRLCGPSDDVEDVLQDTYVEIIRHLGGFRGESSFLTWATAVARSQLYRHRRRHRRYSVRDEAIDLASRSFPELLGVGASEPEEHTHSERLREVLAEALAELADVDRQVFVLRQIEGQTAPEVAAVLDLSVPAVKSRLHRARQLLRDRLANDPRASLAA